jgi:cytochrome b561
LGLKNTTTEWGSLSKALHWLIAIGLFALIYLGLQQAGMERGDEKSNLRFIHASIATVVLILMTVRIIWRLVNDTPAHPDTTTPTQRLISAVVHWGLYVTVFAQLLGGAMMSGTAGRGLPLFEIAAIPLPIAKDEAGHEFWEEFHEVVWIPVAVLIGIHILGALYNHFRLKNDVLRRMTHGVK